MQQPASSSAGIVRIPVSPQARLRAALRMLDTRLAEQRGAVAAWHDELSRLSTLLRNIGTEAQAVQQDLVAMAASLAESRGTCLDAIRHADALTDGSLAGQAAHGHNAGIPS